MLIVFMGESCTGKSTIANKIKEIKDVEVYSGKDYLRFAKNENDAWDIFSEKISSSSETIIYIVTEKHMLDKIQNFNCKKVKFNTDINIIKSRFGERMNNNLPKPVESMLERKHEEWVKIEGELNIDTTSEDSLNDNISKILTLFV